MFVDAAGLPAPALPGPGPAGRRTRCAAHGQPRAILGWFRSRPPAASWPAATKLDVLELAAIDPATALPFLLRPVGSSGGGSDVAVPARDASGLRRPARLPGLPGGKSSDRARAYGWKSRWTTLRSRSNEQVIDQVPAPGTAHRAGEPITLIVSQGPKSTVPIPAAHRPGARSGHRRVGQGRPGRRDRRAGPPSTSLENTVISSDPLGATEVKQSTKVKLLSPASPPSRSPTSSGEPATRRSRRSTASGCRRLTSEQFDDSIPAGGVVSMSPNPNEVVKIGTSVALVISRGRAIFVPELSGRTPARHGRPCRARVGRHRGSKDQRDDPRRDRDRPFARAGYAAVGRRDGQPGGVRRAVHRATDRPGARRCWAHCGSSGGSAAGDGAGARPLPAALHHGAAGLGDRHRSRTDHSAGGR